MPFDPTVVVAVDLDGTITDGDGEPRPRAVRWIRRFQARGWAVVLWSCNQRPVLPGGLSLLGPDDVPPRGPGGGKLNADVYIDNKNPGGCQWLLAYLRCRRLERRRHATCA